MTACCPEVVQQLRQEILLRQGFNPPSAAAIDMGLGPVAAAFPQGIFPTGAMHELLSDGPEGAAATGAWAAVLVGRLMAKGGACIWIGSRRTVYPPALMAFGIEPDRVIFVDIRKEKDGLWVLEEALKCEGLAAVVGEIRDISFLASRRFQLAVEQSRVTGFLSPLFCRRRATQPATVNCDRARWQVTPIAGGREAGALAMPGVGFLRWSVGIVNGRGAGSRESGNWNGGKGGFILLANP